MNTNDTNEHKPDEHSTNAHVESDDVSYVERCMSIDIGHSSTCGYTCCTQCIDIDHDTTKINMSYS